mgnify:CR=1 FL=1
MSDPTAPGPDEVRVRQLLVKNGVGPDGDPDAPSPEEPPEEPPARPRDWLDDILDTNTPAPAPPDELAEEPEEPEPEPAPVPAAPATPAKPKKPKAKKQKRSRPKRHNPTTPRSAWDSRPPDPRQSLLDAWDRVPYRLKWLAYHASAAYLGWSMGLVHWVTYVTAWIADGHLTSPQAVFWYVTGAVVLLLHHRTRSWWRPVAWLAAVPASSTVVGVLLYGTPHP